MGTEAVWVPLAISALGAGASAYNQHQVAKRQEDEAQNASMTQQRKQHEADARLNQELSALSASGPDAERKASLEGFLQQLRANAGAAGGDSNVINASDRFKKDSAASGAAIKNYGTTRSDTLSRINAPGFQRRREGYSINRAGDDVTGIGRDANAEAFLSQLRMNAIRANPWLEAAGQVAQGVGSGMAASGWGTGPKTVSGNAGKFARVMDTPVKVPVQNAHAFA
jgi:hypothetical protein